MKIRSLQQQYKYVIDSNIKIGHSKRNEGKENGLYSIDRIENLRDFSKQFSNYMKENYSDVRLIKDITIEHMQNFLNDNANKWTERTAQEYITNFYKLDVLIQKTFNTKEIEHNLIVPNCHQSVTRDIAMNKRDLQTLRNSYTARDSKSAGRDAIELSYRFGLRIKEIARLDTKNIDINNKVIHIREGAKNGKYRDVPIREKDLQYAKDLKGRGEGYLFNVKEDSINKSIRNELKRVGLAEKYDNTTNHAIRKLYATERMEELRGTQREDPLTNEQERKAWEVVQKELGHGDTLRIALYNTYIKN